MSHFQSMVLAVVLLPALVGCASTKPSCGLVELPITRRDAADAESYISKARTFTLEHWNHAKIDPPRLFPDPLVLVHADGSRCELDTGIYSKVWVSADERTLGVDWNSGSDTFFELWDVASCTVRDRLVVFTAAYRLAGDRLEYDGGCEPGGLDDAICEPAAVWTLDAACRPRLDAEESLRRTRKRFGVAFTTTSEIHFLGTPKVRVIGPRPRWEPVKPKTD